jgi:hypothetical protein
MMATPLLITPDGKKIELPPDIYQQIQKILQERERNTPRSRRIAHIDATYGKYAGKSSLMEALLKERKQELAREEAKLKRRHG